MMLLFDISQCLMDAANSLMGRSTWFDSLVAIPQRNELVKAVPVAACVAAAWYAGNGDAIQRRRALLVAMLAALAAAGLSRGLSHRNALPRPYVFGEQVYRWRGDRFDAQPILDRRAPTDNSSRLRHEKLLTADIPPNDFGSFPSDHASLFFTLACGTCLVSRRAGIVALVWTGAVVLLPRVLLGLHSPLDIAGGCLLGASVLACAMLVDRVWKRSPCQRLAELSMRFPAPSGGLLFAVLFEFCHTFEHASALAGAVLNRFVA